MKVSVIIPAYNEERFLKKCLQSLQNQTIQANEIIVVNNNSTDTTRDIARSFRCIIIDEKKQGISFARNAGFNHATGEILARIDADTIVPKNWVHTVMLSFKNNDVVGVSGPIIFYDFSGGKRVRQILGWIQKFLYFDISRFFMGYNVLFGSNMAIRKNAWTQIKNETCENDRIYHEDMDLSIHLQRIGTILFNPMLRAYISSRRVRAFHTLLDYAVRQTKSILHARKLQKDR